MAYGVKVLLLILALAGATALPHVARAELPDAEVPQRFDVFKATLKQDKGRFLFNGYWMSENELKEVWQNPDRTSSNIRYQRPVPELPHPDLSLNVNSVNGQLDYWGPADRTLSYAIDKSSMTAEQYAILKKDMVEAVTDWEKACPQCGIKFPHVAEADSAPNLDKVRFVVKLDEKMFPNTLGWSFFPSSPKEQRYITLTRNFFAKDSKFSRAGTLRHQIGHILGYRHAHVSPAAGSDCPREGQTFLGARYDPKSVMHYLCGDGGTLEMKLSERDIASHQLLYGFATIQVDIDGKEILKTAARILGLLAAQYGRLTLRPYNIDSIEGCRAYIRDLGLLEEFNSSQSSTDAGCSPFRPLKKMARGRAHLPVLPFNGYIDVASGSFLQTDGVARREFEALRDRVNALKLELGAASSRDKKLLNYLVEWRRFRASIPVAQFEIAKVWSGLNALSKTNRGVSISLDDSIGRSLTSTNEPRRNSVSDPKNPVEFRNAICTGGDVVGHYAMLQGGTQPEFDATTGVPDLKCDYPESANGACKSCGSAVSCSSEACRYCPACNGYRPRAIIIDGSLDLAALKPRAAADPPQTCTWKPFQEQHHGTLMAQILAGNNRFIGFNPGLVPELITNSSTATTQTKFADEVRAKYRPKERGVALITSQLCYPPQLLNEFGVTNTGPCELSGDARPRNPDERGAILTRHLPTKRIKNSGDWLWVAAVGQPKSAGNVSTPPAPTTFNGQSVASPIALADLPHMILVSACEKCSLAREATAERKVWSRANRGTDKLRPHVIAPGGVEFLEPVDGQYVGGLPGFGVGNELMRAYGTSQAAAYVSGLATKMLACYPLHYQSAGELKEALQFTSMPVLSDGGEPTVASGLVDVKAALRNPGYIYFQGSGEGEGQPRRIATDAFRWCANSFRFRTPAGAAPDAMDVENIRRIVSTAASRWVVYERKPETQGVVDRTPVFSGIEDPNEDPWVFMAAGRQYRLSEVKDLQLFNFLPSVSKCE